MLLRTASIFFRERKVGGGGMIASVVLLRGRDLRESLGGDRRLLEAECAFDQRDAIGRRVRIERDDAASPIDCFRAVLSLRDGRKRAAASAPGLDRVGRCAAIAAQRRSFCRTRRGLVASICAPASARKSGGRPETATNRQSMPITPNQSAVSMLGPPQGGLER
jgi:hypothetical protein